MSLCFDLLSTIYNKTRGDGNDIWGWEDPATDDAYAIMGLNEGTAFIRVTDPENPVVVANLETQ